MFRLWTGLWIQFFFFFPSQTSNISGRKSVLLRHSVHKSAWAQARKMLKQGSTKSHIKSAKTNDINLNDLYQRIIFKIQISTLKKLEDSLDFILACWWVNMTWQNVAKVVLMYLFYHILSGEIDKMTRHSFSTFFLLKTSFYVKTGTDRYENLYLFSRFSNTFLTSYKKNLCCST